MAGRVRGLWRQYLSVTRWLPTRDRRTLSSTVDRETIAAHVQQRRDALVAEIDAAAHEICGYASAYDNSVLVTEDSHYRPDLWTWLIAPNAHRGSSWLLSVAHLRLRVIAAEYGIPVTTVPDAYSSQECHACGALGDRVRNAALRCSNRDCHVDTVAADFNAAKVLARRYYPGRRCDSQPRDSPRSDDGPVLTVDGDPPNYAPSDRTERPRDEKRRRR